MKKILSAGAFAVAIVGLSVTAASAQVGQAAEAAHKGTFNYLRDAPDRRSHILMKMEHGTRFQVVGESGDYKSIVLADGTRGWTFNTNVRYLTDTPAIVEPGVGAPVAPVAAPVVVGGVGTTTVVTTGGVIGRAPRAARVHRVRRERVVTRTVTHVVHHQRAPRILIVK